MFELFIDVERIDTVQFEPHQQIDALKKWSDDIRKEIPGKTPLKDNKEDDVATDNQSAAHHARDGDISEPVDTADIVEDDARECLAHIEKQDEGTELDEHGGDTKDGVGDKHQNDRNKRN